MSLPMALSRSIGGGGLYYTASRPTASASVGRYAPSTKDFLAAFYAVLRRWQSETTFLSDPDQITSHPSYEALVQNASLATSLIVEELRKGPSLLVLVLEDAFGFQPYTPDECGNVDAMTEAWISWAERNGRALQD